MVKESDILEIKISDKLLDIAKKRADKFKMNRYTQSNNIDSRVAGFIAEEIFFANFGGEKVADTNYNCDIINTKLNCIDLKTKRCKQKPSIEYECSVSKYQADKGKCDYYIFCRCDYEFKYLWILGAMSQKDFMNKSKLMKVGDRDGTFVCRTDIYQLKIKELEPFADLII